MTILRGDGHLGGVQRDAQQNASAIDFGYVDKLDMDFEDGLGQDCLHYVLPGVPDWWNHLLFFDLDVV